MSKDETLMVKGVAILLMVFGHLFNQPEEVAHMQHLITIQGVPLVKILMALSSPLHIFLMLGGYGMYMVWVKGDRNRWRRIAKLVVNYWVILAVFLSIGHVMKPEIYPGSWSEIIGNFLGTVTSYNHEMWFLLPYIVLGLISPFIFRMTRRVPWYILLLVVIGGYMGYLAYFNSRGWGFESINFLTYNLYRLIQITPSFIIGAVFARENFFDRLKSVARRIPGTGYWSWTALAGCLILCCLGIYYSYPYMLVSLLLVVPIPVAARTVLITFGKRSMGMWMIHTWFCYYLFRDEIYGLKYPVVIFLVMVAVTYAAAVVSEIISGYILQGVYPVRKETMAQVGEGSSENGVDKR